MSLKVFSSSMKTYPGFQLKAEISTVFIEVDKHVLLLKRSKKEDQSDTWGIPGGKKELHEQPIDTLLREVKEETQIDLYAKEISYHGHRYARIPNWDYIIHLYRVNLKERPAVILSKEHTAYRWVSIYAFKMLNLVKGQDEAFDIVYDDKVWRKVDNDLADKVNSTASLTLKKGTKELRFTQNRRFILNLIGTSGSGKGTQGEMLSKIYGIPNVSAGDLFRDEFREKSFLGEMIQLFDRNHFPAYLPDEVPVGMMIKRLTTEDCKLGFIFDGFPRTKVQTEVTASVILKSDDLHVPLFMDVEEKSILERLSGRSICNECGHQVREFDENPWPGFCPIEAASGKMIPLEKRVEDINQEKIERRLKMFRENKDVIVEGLEKRDKVHSFKLDNKIPPLDVLHLLSETIQKRLDEYDSK